MVCPVSFHLNGECEHHRVQRPGCRGRLNPHSADTCQQWVGVTALAASAGQRSVPHGLFECSSVDAIWVAAAAADRISPVPNPGQTGSHILQGSESDHQTPAFILHAAFIISHIRTKMDKNKMQKLIDVKSDRVTFELNSGKVYSDVWKQFVCVHVDSNTTEFVKCGKCHHVTKRRSRDGTRGLKAHVDSCGILTPHLTLFKMPGFSQKKRRCHQQQSLR